MMFGSRLKGLADRRGELVARSDAQRVRAGATLAAVAQRAAAVERVVRPGPLPQLPAAVMAGLQLALLVLRRRLHHRPVLRLLLLGPLAAWGARLLWSTLVRRRAAGGATR